MENKDDILLQNHIAKSQIEFWDERDKQSLIQSFMATYRKEVVMTWLIVDIVINGDKILLKWKKRIIPLTEQDYKDKFIK